MQTSANRNTAAQNARTSAPTVVIRSDAIPYGVLVVSKQSEMCNSIEKMLLDDGETVFTAGNVHDAWENIRIGRVGLVILDLRQPAPEDFLLVSTVRAVPASARTTFLFLKAKGPTLPVLRVDGDDHVRDGWVDLPCETAEILAAVARLFQQRAYSHRMKQQKSPSGSTADLAAAASNVQAGVSSSFQGMFSGKLGALDVPQILGMLAPMNLSGVLTLKYEKRKGQIFLVNGAVWHATFAAVSGAEALTILFRLRQGKFSFDATETLPERSIQSNTMGLLLEGLRERDETKALVDSARRASGNR